MKRILIPILVLGLLLIPLGVSAASGAPLVSVTQTVTQRIVASLISASQTITQEIVAPRRGGGGGGGGGGDRTPPTISDIGLCPEGAAETTADICWKTQERSDSQVEYWCNGHKDSELDEEMVVYHHVQLTGLVPGTTYYYKTMSRDRAGNLAVSDEYTFTTLGEAPVKPEPAPPEAEEPEPIVPEPTPPSKPEPAAPAPEEPTPWLLIGGLIGAAAVGGGIGYWLWRRRRQHLGE
ncbi:hypothetical protein ES703_89895 [subsurface metagenome]